MAQQKQGSVNGYSVKGLSCPLCLDIFKDATILTGCGHSFCRRCLKRYDIANRELDHIVCPVCRKNTKWKKNRVDGLISNHTVNDFIYGLYGKSGGPSRSPRQRNIKCNACKLQVLASYFCKNCEAFMCRQCLESHQKMSSLFVDHDVQPLKEILKNINFVSPSEDDIEEDMQLKIDDLMQQCRATVAKLKENPNGLDIEEQRTRIQAAMAKLQDDINQAYKAKAKQMMENREKLVNELQALELGSGDD